MIKILIADDEEFSRKQAKHELLRMGINESCLLEAQNGTEALLKAQKTKIDLLLTDIRMPRMLGTELAQKVLQLYPNCKVLFLSGYSDKEYLKAAIKLNVVDYIEKPLDKEEFTAAVKKALNELNKSNKEEYELSIKMLETLFKNQPFQPTSLPASLLKVFESTEFVAIIIAPCTEYTTDIISIIKEGADRCSVSMIFRFKSNGNIEILFAGDTGSLKQNTEKIFDFFFSRIGEQEKYKCAVGTYESQSNNIYISYENAACALDNAFFYPPNGCVYFSENTQGAIVIDNEKITSELAAHLSGEDFSGIREDLDSLYKTLYKSNSHLSSAVKKIYYIIFENIHLFFKNYFFAYNNEFSLYDDTFNIYEAQFLDDLNDHIISNITRIEKRLKSSESNSLVKAALYFIKQNWQNPYLSIIDIAQHCNVNANYLCSMFKSVTDETINHYVNNLRIENAKKMLLETNLHIAKIAEKCGFNDSKYFCKVFGKYANLTPTEFRKKYK